MCGILLGRHIRRIGDRVQHILAPVQTLDREQTVHSSIEKYHADTTTQEYLVQHTPHTLWVGDPTGAA